MHEAGRGGDFGADAIELRVSRRVSAIPENPEVGFRCVLRSAGR